MVVCGAIALLLPIRAYEVALLLLVTSPVIALAVSELRRRAPTMQPPEGNRRQVPIGLQAVTLILAIFVGGAITYLVNWQIGSRLTAPWYLRLVAGALIWPLTVVWIFVVRDRLYLGPTRNLLSERGRSQRRIRFTLRDVMLAVVVIAATCSILAVVFRHRLAEVSWQGIVTPAICLVVTTVASCAVILFTRRRWLSLILLVASVSGPAAAHSLTGATGLPLALC